MKKERRRKKGKSAAPKRKVRVSAEMKDVACISDHLTCSNLNLTSSGLIFHCLTNHFFFSLSIYILNSKVLCMGESIQNSFRHVWNGVRVENSKV